MTKHRNEGRVRVELEHGVLDAPSREAAALAVASMQRAQARADRRRELWGEDNDTQMTRLARSFPSLAGAAGVEPWDAGAFLDWLLGPAPSSGAWHAGCFVLSVWNASTDWAAVAREEDLVKPDAVLDMTFRVTRAFGTWDDDHRDAFRRWVDLPFFP